MSSLRGPKAIPKALILIIIKLTSAQEERIHPLGMDIQNRM